MEDTCSRFPKSHASHTRGNEWKVLPLCLCVVLLKCTGETHLDFKRFVDLIMFLAEEYGPAPATKSIVMLWRTLVQYGLGLALCYLKHRVMLWRTLVQVPQCLSAHLSAQVSPILSACLPQCLHPSA
jgi:hypothetical protein